MPSVALLDDRRRRAGRFASISALLLCIGRADGRAAAQDPEPQLTDGFAFARFATETGRTLFAGRGIGRYLLVVGVLQNPQTEYREALAAVGWRRGWGRSTATFLTAVADASDGTYLQFYALPAVSSARTQLSATIELYQPLGARGTRQLYLNPVTFTAGPWHGLHLGGAIVLSAAHANRPSAALGPVLQLDVRGATVAVELLRRTERRQNDVRLSILAPL